MVVADSPFLPARGGGEREHLGFVRAAVDTGHLGVLIVPSSEPIAMAPYRELLGDVPMIVTRRRESKLLLAHPVTPYVVSSRPVRRGLVDRVRAAAPGATGVVVFSYKSWRIGELLARELGVPAVLRQHNLEGPYHRSLAAGSTGARKLVMRVEAGRIERDERRLEQAPWLRTMADISATDSEQRRERGGRSVHVPPFAHDPALLELPRKPAAAPHVLFVGALDVPTNTTALDWLVGRVWKTVRARVPDAVLDVVGRGPTADLRTWLAGEPGVSLHADVPDMHPFLSEATVAVNPAVSGSGVNIKLVDYLQAGVPVVTTTLGAQGLGYTDGDVVAVKDDPVAFGEAVAALLLDRDRAEKLGAAGREDITRLLDPVANIARLETELAAVPPGGDGSLPSSPAKAKNAITVELDDLDRLAGPGRAEWDALHQRQTGVANPFTAPEWIETWYRHFTEAPDRHLLVVRRGEELIGVAPFYRDPVAFGPARIGTKLRLAGAGQGGSLLELPQVLAAPEHAREVIRVVVAATIKAYPEGGVADWAEVTITNAQGWFEPEWSVGTGEPVAFSRQQMARACVVLPLGADWESTLSGFKRNLKESLRRSRNRLAKDGRPWTLEEHTETLDEAAVDRFLTLHRQRSLADSAVRHADAYANPRFRDFLRDVLPQLGHQGRATLLELRLGGTLVAVQLALSAPGTTYFHSSGVDPEVWSLGPVTFLQEQLARRAVERGDGWINFSPGPNVAKLRWSEQIDLHSDFAYGSGPDSLRLKYAAFAMWQSVNQFRHSIAMSAPAPAATPEPLERGKHG